MARKRGKFWGGSGAILLTLGVLFLAAAIIIGENAERQGTRFQLIRGPERAGDQGAGDPSDSLGIDRGEPSDLGDLRRTVNTIEKQIDEGAWDEAERSIFSLRQHWVSFKPPMRASAGRIPWTTSDIDDFQEAMNALESAVGDRNRAAAKREVERLLGLIDRYDAKRPDFANLEREEIRLTDDNPDRR